MIQCLLGLFKFLTEILHESTEIFFLGRMTKPKDGFSSSVVDWSSFLEAVSIDCDGAQDQVTQ